MTVLSHTIQPEEQGMRIDKVLASLNEDASRSQVQSWIKDQLVKVDDEPIKSNYKCQKGATITWEIPEPEVLDVIPENIPLDIIYEDSDVLVVNKPRGMVVHPSAGHGSGTLVNALMYHCNDLSGINGILRPGIVHRIDMDTSGLLMVAKNDKAHVSLVDQLKEKTVKRSYEAIVHGTISHEVGTIDAPLGRDPKDRQKMAVVDGGKHAVTHFEVIKRFENDFTHVKCVLETGRTHQIRVHMQYIGFPLVGDPKYGPRKTLEFDGQALHATVLGFEHPTTGEWMEFEVAPPEDFENLLEKLEKMS
ncbi:RluA family pseudouridine synthase [Aquibacillus koreensis]|uniref:Pseudouridine synthase n=1 Tax=Aquibacillus koreensis TaxID=279446 RepID=A0A9X4AHX5_9BACI|nr:RluA family pseudouridine synthase [Aquibacillus koreensis]MCT2538039.1 RluA family pseudouridine synthase [Aquibacillus koreensis]MDC3420562.1 RluA family pseudouridine synthase [Aquibacillus koreensis]